MRKIRLKIVRTYAQLTRIRNLICEYLEWFLLSIISRRISWSVLYRNAYPFRLRLEEYTKCDKTRQNGQQHKILHVQILPGSIRKTWSISSASALICINSASFHPEGNQSTTIHCQQLDTAVDKAALSPARVWAAAPHVFGLTDRPPLDCQGSFNGVWFLMLPRTCRLRA
jgi:hypothetical protein